MESRELVTALLDPAAYPQRPASVELRETHISWVFLADELVFKVKKPVNLEFLDYSTRTRRRIMCRREVELNQRMSAGVYLGVDRITAGPDGGVCINGRGRVLDYAVRMRRLPEEATLTAHLQRDTVRGDDIAKLATLLARFHAEAATGPHVDRFGRIRALRRNAEENFRQTAEFAGGPISRREFEEVAETTRRMLTSRRGLFNQRVADGRIRDGHGDLRTDHVYFDDGIQVIDCIEFNDRFRFADAAADIAFLAMDLDAHAAPALAGILVDAYAEAAGDDDIRAVLGYYLMYRAFTRAKVACMRTSTATGGPEEVARAELEARRYGHLALRYARNDRGPRLIITAGITGTGKTTLAKTLGEALCAKHISADQVRKELAGLEASDRRHDPVDQGLYAPEMNERVYSEMLSRAEAFLRAGNTVVLDATFRRRADRERAAELARRFNCRFLAVHCVAPPETVRERIERRAEEGSDWSDGRWDIYLAQAAAFEELDELPADNVAAVDATLARAKQATMVVDRLEA
jgi:uncharacterized protein